MGVWSLWGEDQRRLGSKPMNYARELPWMTPSTLTMGTILNTKLLSKFLAV